MISKMIPTRMMANRIKKATAIVELAITISESSEMVPEMAMVTRKIVTTQRTVFCRSRFAAAGSVLDTVEIPLVDY